jgi:hypothetical protein
MEGRGRIPPRKPQPGPLRSRFDASTGSSVNAGHRSLDTSVWVAGLLTGLF